MSHKYKKTVKKYNKAVKKLKKSLKGLPLILQATSEIKMLNFERSLKESTAKQA